MSKRELINMIAKKLPDLPVYLVKEAVEVVFSTIALSLHHHQRVELRGLGSFSIKKRKKRIARNPQTGERVLIEEKWVPVFRPGNLLRHALKEQTVSKGGRKEKNSSVIYRDFSRSK